MLGSVSRRTRGGGQGGDRAGTVFYRGQSAYIVGLLYAGSHRFPLIIALSHGDEGIFVDAVLLTEDEASIVFSFTRSYFHVDVARPYDLARFLRRLMPRKRLAEIYIAVGQNKHGKTELYRDSAPASAIERGAVPAGAGDEGPRDDRVRHAGPRRRLQGDP